MGVEKTRTKNNYGGDFHHTNTNHSVSNLSKRVEEHNLKKKKKWDEITRLIYPTPIHITNIAIRGTLTLGLRDLVYKLALFFSWLCSKLITVAEINPMKAESAEIMCGFEMEMPPTFFDIMPNLEVRLAKEV